MSVIAIVTALLLEQWRPLSDRSQLFAPLVRWSQRLESGFDAGERPQGILAWALLVVPALLLALLLHRMLGALSPVFALLFDIGALYLTLGFRQFSHSFTALQKAIKSGELDQARELISGWRGEPTLARSREEVIRLAIEEALLASHRHVFGVLFWYILLPGPTGAILYRLAAFLRRRWGGRGPFGAFAVRAFDLLEWPSVRVTAVAFAIAGDFEDAIYCWRTQARAWPDPNAGILLAAGAGAMGVRLGMPVQGAAGIEPRIELGIGEPADGPMLDSTVGLLWRALVGWVFVLGLLALAYRLG